MAPSRSDSSQLISLKRPGSTLTYTIEVSSMRIFPGVFKSAITGNGTRTSPTYFKNGKGVTKQKFDKFINATRTDTGEKNPLLKISSRHAHENSHTFPPPPSGYQNTMNTLLAAVQSQQSSNLSIKKGVRSKVFLLSISRQNIDGDYNSDNSATLKKYFTYDGSSCTGPATIQNTASPGDNVFVSRRESREKKRKTGTREKLSSVSVLSSRLRRELNSTPSNLCSSLKATPGNRHY